MRKLFEQKKDCCGCGACAAICKAGAIEMKRDTEGFLYPSVDASRCVDCGMCEKVCPMKKGIEKLEGQQFFAVKIRSEEKRRKSQSGGLFWAMAEQILREGGHVYGAMIGKDFYVQHRKAETIAQAEPMRGSKYVQSDTRDTFREVREDLRKGICVLYTGTPCQIAGLKSFLGALADDSHLLLVDIICAGVPSPAVHPKMIEWIERTGGKKVVDFEFRDVREPWGKVRQNYVFADGSSKTDSHFSWLFSQKLAHRESCLDCPFARPDRVSDITIGDFWGINSLMPEFRDEIGVSIAVLNTPRGKGAFESVQEELIVREANWESAMHRQPRLAGGAQNQPFPGRRKAFWSDFSKKPMEKVLRKHTPYGGIPFRVRRKILITLRRW